MPLGADTVVQVEHTDLDYSAPVTKNDVLVYHPAPPGSNIRKKGEFFNAGDLLLSPGQALRPQDIATIAMVGKPTIKVIRQPKVGLLTTGDELVYPGDPISPGKIRDTNSFMLAALLEAKSAAVLRSGIVQDNEESVLEALENLLQAKVDFLLTSGGVSMGAYDIVRKVIEEYGKLKLWRVNMRPGKPLAFGEFRNIPFIGLPGNPVSAFVGFQIFVKPVLNKMLGVSYNSPSTQKAKLLQPVTSDGRETYIPALLDLQNGEWVAAPAKNQSSGNLFALIPGNSLIILPIGVKFLNKGETVEVLKLDLG